MKDKVSLQFKPETMMGIVSIAFFAASVVIFGGGVAYSAWKHGQAGVILGIAMVIVPVFSGIGMGVAINGILKKECTHRMARIGLLLNILALVTMICVYVAGILILI